MRSHRVETDLAKQIVGTEASARAEDGTNVFALKHLRQLLDATLYRPGKVQIFFENGIEIERNISGAAQSFATSFEISTLDVARRRDDANGIAGAKGRRLDALRIG